MTRYLTAVNEENSRVITLRAMTSADIQSVLAMRNHIEVRKYMLSTHLISLDEHIKWFSGAIQSTAVELLVLDIDSVCTGFVQLQKTKYQGVLDWGFYVAPGSPKGTGRILGQAAIEHAFGKSDCYKMCGQAISWNRSSISFHKSLGFVQEGVLREHHNDGTSCHHLICFGLLKHEWLVKKNHG